MLYLVEAQDSTADYGWEIEATTPVRAMRRALLEAAHEGIELTGQTLSIKVRPVDIPDARPWWQPFRDRRQYS